LKQQLKLRDSRDQGQAKRHSRVEALAHRGCAIEKALEREGLIELRGYGRGAHIVPLTEPASR
jgi:hypothetical protein